MQHKIFSICRRAESHKDYCEDAHFILDYNSMTICGVFDGCSTGKNSHFASALMAECLRKSFATTYKLGHTLYELISYNSGNIDFINQTILLGILNFKQIAIGLELPELNLLTTAGIAIYFKKEKKLVYKFLGDGSVYYSLIGAETSEKICDSIHFQGNAPDYVAYHLSSTQEDLAKWIEEQMGKTIENVQSFCLCTDGIDSARDAAKTSDSAILKANYEGFLLEDQFLNSSDKMLQRKVNILKKGGLLFDDDLTIIRYDSYETI